MNTWLKEEKICNVPAVINKLSPLIVKKAAFIAAFLMHLLTGIVFVSLIMAEDLNIVLGTQKEKYESILPQINALLEGEPDLVANLANVTAALKEQFNWFWVGFYLVRENELVLAPFQGPVACTRIKKGRGVCGTSWAQGKTLIVPDVEKFPGHIACSSLSRSEIVVPIIRNAEVIGVLDVDSEELNAFNEVDQQNLEKIVELINF